MHMPREQPLQEMQQEQQTKPSLLYHGPYNVGDLVRKRKPIVPKGTSPFTSLFKIIEVIGITPIALTTTKFGMQRILSDTCDHNADKTRCRYGVQCAG